MIKPSSLTHLVSALQLQKSQLGVTYNLLLTSTISLTPNVIKQLYPSQNWTNFGAYLHKREKEHGDLIHLLTQYIGIHNNVEGYRALAHLIKEGYFSTILTTNLDSTLEDMLLEIGLSPAALQTFIVGEDKDEVIARALDEHHSTIRIIKLYGSLRERSLPRQFPDFSKPPIPLRESLERTLNQNIVIVGSMRHDEDIVAMMTASKKSRIYYAFSRKSVDDPIFKLIEARGNTLCTALISGHQYREFTAFFQSLKRMVLPEIALQLLSEPILPPPIAINRMAVRDKTPLADVLLITATEIEAKAILDQCPTNVPRFIGTRAYYDLGIIGGARLFMAQSEMGSDGLSGSRFTVEDGINVLSPSAVIMVGIAFGLKEEEHQLGDILVSRQLVAYDNQRIGLSADGKQAIRLRGDRITAPTWLLDRFKTGRNIWSNPPDVHFGLILSGSKLIANQDFRDQLRQIESEAIGGEMEGVGLYEAAQRHNVGWLLVKAICDWADNNKAQDKERRQKEAATNAARFIFHVIQQGGFCHSYLEKAIQTSI